MFAYLTYLTSCTINESIRHTKQTTTSVTDSTKHPFIKLSANIYQMQQNSFIDMILCSVPEHYATLQCDSRQCTGTLSYTAV